MSKKRKDLLGPDGKPLDRRKYAPKEERKTEGAFLTYEGGLLSGSIYRLFLGHDQGVTTTPKSKGPALSEAVARDINAIKIPLRWKGGQELPAPERDLTTYADAYDSAVKNCPHENITNLLYMREWVCEDCQRHLDQAAMRKAGKSSWYW